VLNFNPAWRFTSSPAAWWTTFSCSSRRWLASTPNRQNIIELGQHWDYLLRQIPRTLKLTALVGGHQTWFSPGVVKSARGKYRRATKPQLLTREQLDGRTNAAKVFDGLVSDIEGDLGGHDQLSTIERALVEAFAGATGGDAASEYPARAQSS
jgi:hypothetical protein